VLIVQMLADLALLGAGVQAAAASSGWIRELAWLPVASPDPFAWRARSSAWMAPRLAPSLALG